MLPPSASAILGGDALAQEMQQYVQTQQAELDKGRKKGTLSYDLQTRVKEVGLSHGPRLYVCQAPNAFICVSGVAPPKHQMRLYVCHQMRLLNPQRSSLRSLTFARFARTFF